MTTALSFRDVDTSRPLSEITIGGLLRSAAAEAPENLALIAGYGDPALRRTWTYAELLRDSEQTARALLAFFTPGERVVLWATNVPEWVLLEFGCALAGLVLVAANPALRAPELAYIVRQSGASGIIHTDELRGTDMKEIVRTVTDEVGSVRRTVSITSFELFLQGANQSVALPEVRPGDAAQIQYTSGTTGFPKGALLHHRGLVNNARFVYENLAFPPGGVAINPMPMFHTAGCVLGTLGPVWMRGTMVLVPAFDPGVVLDLVEKYHPSLIAGVPTMLIALLDHPTLAARDLSSLTTIMSGGAPVPAPLVRRIDALGPKVSIVFGQTELAPVVSQTVMADSEMEKAETVGRPLPHVAIKVIDSANGHTIEIGKPGEICAKGYQVMLGYWDDPASTAATIDGDGWLHTGDIGTLDDQGFLRITGRLKDMIIRGGENVYPKEIEDVLLTHPSIVDVAVVGVPDDKWGEQVAAVIRWREESDSTTSVVSAADLLAFCVERLAPHKTPRYWMRTDTFPLTGSGKVQKFRIREQLAAGELSPLA
jgi:fatty-acyl-CoA synthase